MNLHVQTTDDEQTLTTVVLSETNLRNLLAGFEQTPYIAALSRKTPEGRLLVRVESDAEHYKDREPGPGLAPFVSGL